MFTRYLGHLSRSFLPCLTALSLVMGCSDSTTAPASGSIEPENATAWNTDEVGPEAHASPAEMCARDSTPINDETAPHDLLAELTAVNVTGFVSRNGSPTEDLFDWTTTTKMVFTDVRTGHSYAFETGCRPVGQYNGTLFAGTYDITLEVWAQHGHCNSGCIVYEVGESIPIHQSRTFDVDVPFVRQIGVVTLDGAPIPPDDSSAPIGRGRLVFVDTKTGARYPVDLETTGRASFEAFVPAREYDIWWRTGGSGHHAFDGIDAQTLPGGSAFLGTHVLEQDSEHLSLDAESVRVSGEVRIDGTALPDDVEPDGRNRAELALRAAGPVPRQHTISLGETGPATYRAWLFAGSYHPEFSTTLPNTTNALRGFRRFDLCDSGTCPLDLNSDTRIDFDLPNWADNRQVEVSGRVSYRGPDGAVSTCDGALRFKAVDPEADGAINTSRNIPEDGSWSTRVSPGRYKLTFTSRYNCDANGAAVLDDDLVIRHARDGLTYVLDSGRVSGEVTVNGNQMPDNGVHEFDPRASIEFEHVETGHVVERELGERGPATYDVHLLPGHYRVKVRSYAVIRGIRYYRQDVLPRGGRVIDVIEVAGEDIRKDIDLDVVRLNGELRVNGTSFDSEAYQNQNTRLEFHACSDDEFVPVSVPPDGGSFEDVLIFEGRYDIRTASDRTPRPPWVDTLVDVSWGATE